MNKTTPRVLSSLFGLAVILSIAAALVGCDQHAISQSPPATTTAAALEQSDSRTGNANQAAEVQPAAHQAPSVAPAAVEAAPPANDGPPRPSALRPKADRGTTADGVEKITFDDLILGMQADMVYRPWMLESETNGGRAKELEGKKVRLAGIMHGGVDSQTKNKDFVLLRNKECKFGPGGQADHLAKIFMKEGKTAKYAGDVTVVVEGTLKIEAETGDDGNTWSIYRIEGAEVK
jgi:hypothetical protein